MKRLLCATLSAAVCVATVTPALAQDYGFYDAFAGRRDAATATANLKVPLGATNAKPTYGLTLNYGPAAVSPSGFSEKPQVKLADLRFSSEGLDQAKLGGFDFAQADGDVGDRLNMTGGDNTVWVVVGLVAAGVAICVLADCFDDDDDDDD